MCICGGDTPNGFGATELWKLTRFGKRENKLNLGAHIFRSDYAIMTELVPKWSPFHVLCDDLHIVGDTPYRFGVIQLWSWQNLGNVKIGFNVGAYIFQSDYAIMTELAPKWSPFHVLCDDLNIVGDTPYRFGVIQLWSWQNLGNVKIDFNLGAYIFRSDYAIMTELAPKWSPFDLLCDDLHIVGDTPYRFGVIQLWSWLYYERRKSG